MYKELKKFPKIILIGPQGSGKSSLAVAIQKEISQEFAYHVPIFEQDEILRSKIDVDIPEFSGENPLQFRLLESRFLEDSLESNSGIVSSGGGVVYPTTPNLDFNLVKEISTRNLDFIKRSGYDCIYLKPAKTIEESIKICEKRLKNANNSDHRIKLPIETLRIREPYYQKAASHTYLTNNISISDLAKQIVFDLYCENVEKRILN